MVNSYRIERYRGTCTEGNWPKLYSITKTIYLGPYSTDMCMECRVQIVRHVASSYLIQRIVLIKTYFYGRRLFRHQNNLGYICTGNDLYPGGRAHIGRSHHSHSKCYSPRVHNVYHHLNKKKVYMYVAIICSDFFAACLQSFRH